MHTLMTILMGHPICIVLGLSFIVVTLPILRRLYFHPLSSFPGPRMAAVTSLYKTYYEVIQGGGMLEQTRYLHTIYGEPTDFVLSLYKDNDSHPLEQAPLFELGPTK